MLVVVSSIPQASAFCVGGGDAAVCWTTEDAGNEHVRDCFSVDAAGQHVDRCTPPTPSYYFVYRIATAALQEASQKVGGVVAQFAQCTAGEVCEHVPVLP